MATSTFLAQQQRLQRKVGDLSAGTLVSIKDVLNETLLELCDSYDWRWLDYDGAFAVEAAYTTGTITVTAGSATVSLVGGTWSTGWANRKIRTAGGEIYKLSAIGTTTSGTLDRNAVATETAVAYTMYRDVYALAARMRSIYTAWASTVDGYPVEIWTPDQMAVMKTQAFAPNSPVQAICMTTQDSSEVPQVEVWPVPIANSSVWYKGYRQMAPLSADGDTYSFPTWLLPSFQTLAMSKFMEWKGRTEAALVAAKTHQLALEKALQRDNPTAGRGDAITLDPNWFLPRGYNRTGLPNE